jgi:multicomponent Na+:H+ antiporter subunit B
MLLFSWFILFRGHNEPGGGFIAGLITASAFSIYLMAHGPNKARQLLFLDLRYILAIGAASALTSGLIGILNGKSFLTGVWAHLHVLTFSITLGSPILFDIGVYLVVVSAILMIIFALEEK